MQGILGDLLSATEAVGDEDVAGRSGSDGGKEDALGQNLGDCKLFFFEAKGSGHAAASGVEDGDLGTRTLEKLDLGLHLRQRFLVAVAVQDDGAAGERGRLIIWRVAKEKIAEEEGLLAQVLGSGMVREKIAEFVAKNAGAGGFEEDDGKASVDPGGETIHDAFEIGAGFGEKSEIVQGAAAADMSSRDLNLEAGVREDFVAGREGLGMEIVVPGVRPEEDGGPVRTGRLLPLATLETARGEAGQRALWRDAKERPGGVTQAGHVKRKIGEMRSDSGDERREMRPLVHESESVVAKGTAMAPIVVGEEFSLVRSDVDVDGALGFAGFAGEAQVERFVNGLALPVLREDVAFEHLPEKMGAAPRGVLLFLRGHVAGAHGSGSLFATGSDADAAQRGFGERTLIVGKLEECLLTVRFVTVTET